MLKINKKEIINFKFFLKKVPKKYNRPEYVKLKFDPQRPGMQ